MTGWFLMNGARPTGASVIPNILLLSGVSEPFEHRYHVLSRTGITLRSGGLLWRRGGTLLVIDAKISQVGANPVAVSCPDQEQHLLQSGRDSLVIYRCGPASEDLA